MSVASILTETEAWPAARHVVLTGGEPMIARGIHELASAFRDRGFHITIETAATIAPDGIACDLASLSPKLRHATPLSGEIDTAWIDKHERLRYHPEILRQWADQRTGEVQYKFVVTSSADLTEITELFHAAKIQPEAHRVLLMPEGRTTDELRERQKWLVDVCKASGYRYCQRLHLELFGNTRGT